MQTYRTGPFSRRQPSTLERVLQRNADIPEGTFCCVSMVIGTKVRKGGKVVGTVRDGGKNAGSCPRFATVNADGRGFCTAHAPRKPRD